jgi:broad specificity phosphatase PhoE
VDLYAFQGLLKARGKARHGSAYALWQRSPEQFELKDEEEIGGGTHAPVRELWHRAGLAWGRILAAAAEAEEDGGGDDASSSAILVVAHNAVNQALVGAALGLGPEHFRRLLQSNGATTVVDFAPSSSAEEGEGGNGGSAALPARAALDRLNETAGGVQAASLAKPRDRSSKSAVAARLVMVRTAGANNDDEQQEASSLAAALAPALAAGARVAAVLYPPGDAAAEAVARRAFDGVGEVDDGLAPPRQGETRQAFWARTQRAWRRAAGAALEAAADGDDEDASPPPLAVVLCSSAAPLSALVGHAISGAPEGSDDPSGPQARACLAGALRFDAGGATVVDLFGRGVGDGAAPAPSPPAVVRTLNAALSDAPAPVARGKGPLPSMPEAVAGLVD